MTSCKLEIITGGGIVSPKGFQAAATYCRIKKKEGSLDLGLIMAEFPSTAAAVFTTNQICAAPVKLGRQVIRDGHLRAFVINSGNANACTGEQGYRDAEEMARIAAHYLNVSEEEILVASTGIIGRPLPMDKIAEGIETAAANMGKTREHGEMVTKAIMTTDTFPKNIAVRFKINGHDVTIGGISKGAGMISPNMATMLCFITTDASLSPELIHGCLLHSVESSFNRITIDGHMSTNDTTAIIANGASGVHIAPKSSELELFQKGLDYVTDHLAKAIVRDGEGATKFIQIEVVGAKTQNDAAKIARAIANSPLVKTAINGEDPNWGRIISAAGYAGVVLDESRTNLYLNNSLIYAKGMPAPCDHNKLCGFMKSRDIEIRLDLGLGIHSDTIWTCDLSYEYVTINAEYHT